jgi:glycosyltransferase involved in cell wall biosynthesis
MKVCVVSTPVFRLGQGGLHGYGGLEQIAWQTARGLAGLGHEVALVAPDGSECPGVTVLPCGPERQVDEKGAYQRYWQYLPNFDVVVDHSWQKWAYLLKEEGVLKAPVLGVMHAPVNTMFQTLPPVEKPCVVCISRDQASHFEALFGRPARVAYNGVDPEFYKPLGVPRSERFLFLARFSAIKGADIAIEACKRAGVGLDLVGDTTITNEPDYLRHCQSMADGQQIRIVGGVSRGETVWWYSQAKAMVHPNQRFREPYGLAPVEAMMCGCPVIAWDYGAMRETVPHGEQAFVNDLVGGELVSSMDDLVKAVSRSARENLHPDQRNNLRKWASQFSVENMVLGYDKLIKEAVETGGW